MLYSNVPMTPSGVGFDSPTRWVYTHYDGLLNSGHTRQGSVSAY